MFEIILLMVTTQMVSMQKELKRERKGEKRKEENIQWYNITKTTPTNPYTDS